MATSELLTAIKRGNLEDIGRYLPTSSRPGIVTREHLSCAVQAGKLPVLQLLWVHYVPTAEELQEWEMAAVLLGHSEIAIFLGYKEPWRHPDFGSVDPID